MSRFSHFLVTSLSFLSLFFLDFLVFLSLARISLFFFAVFLFFSRDFRGSVAIENPCFLVVFLALFQKKQGKEGQGLESLYKKGKNLDGGNSALVIGFL